MTENKTKPDHLYHGIPGVLYRHPGNLCKHKHGKGCLYIKRLEDIDMEVLRTLISTSIERLPQP